MALAFPQLSAKDSILVLLEAEGLACLDLLVVEHVGLHRVLVSYFIYAPFLLLGGVGPGPCLRLLLLFHKCLNRLLIQISGIAESATDLLDLAAVTISFNPILL